MYLYDGNKFYSVKELRKAIWEKENKLIKFIADNNTEEWNKLGVTIEKEEATKPTLAEQKELKLSQLKALFNSKLKNASIVCSLGLVVNADDVALINVKTLIEAFPEGDKVDFYDLTNTPTKLDLNEVKTIYQEICQNRLNLYKQKWALREKIQNAKSEKALNGIELKIENADFYM